MFLPYLCGMVYVQPVAGYFCPIFIQNATWVLQGISGSSGIRDTTQNMTLESLEQGNSSLNKS